LKAKPLYQRLFTPLVTLWYFLFQRVNANHTLDAAAADARAGGADVLNRGLSRRLTSASSSSYSDARQRVPWQFLAEALALQGGKIAALSPASQWRGFVIALLDGSTVRLRPHNDIPEHFPAHSNQHCQRTYWCLMRVVVSFCALSGAALSCAMGSTHASEQVLACQIILGAATRSLFVGDRNFGVFRVVQATRQAKREILVRMSALRATKLLGRALIAGDHIVSWKPTRHDQLEPGCSRQPIKGRLLVARLARPGFRPQLLCLFTTLTDAAQYSLEELVKLYGLRWHIELNLRYLKAQMELVQLEVHSADMARKEWLAGLMAYNLIRAAMLCAALHKQISPLTLSFSATRIRLEYWLRQFGRSPREARANWQRSLQEISRCLLPRRRRPRPQEPRAQRHVREPYGPLIGSRAEARQKLHLDATKS
jgi:DDE family transposase